VGSITIHNIDSNMFTISFVFFLIGLGDVVDWVSVEDGEITLYYIVPLAIISTSPVLRPLSHVLQNKGNKSGGLNEVWWSANIW
jgi:hypothetical protein